jgi:beta-lactamase superfamily II metal-dependent hydrolase
MRRRVSNRRQRLSTLRVTLIDVGWGDSLFLESHDGSTGKDHYALIDSNDTSTFRSSYIFVKRFFEKKNITLPSSSHTFEWVLLTHAHADHGQGLKKILRDFGTKCFWYSTSASEPDFFADLLRFADQSDKVGQYDSVDTSKILPRFGRASMQPLWPNPGQVSKNENDNSVVLVITLGQVSFVLTGDAEADGVWTQIAGKIPRNTGFFKVPHHGSENGTFTSSGATPWLPRIRRSATVGISSHVRPFSHPDPKVVTALAAHKPVYRTDQHYHVTFETNGSTVEVSYSHI